MILVQEPPVTRSNSRMMTMMLPLKRNSLRKKEEDDILLPDMKNKSPSRSIDTTLSSSASELLHDDSFERINNHNPHNESSSPPLFSSSSRMQQRLSQFRSKNRNSPGNNNSKHEAKQRFRRHSSFRRKSRQGNEDHEEDTANNPSNSSILMGADIIKRQLSCDNGSSNPFASPMASCRRGLNHSNSSERDIYVWDPWKEEQEEESYSSSFQKRQPHSIAERLKGRILDYHSSNHSLSSFSNDDSIAERSKSGILDSLTSNHTSSPNKQRAQEILSNGDKLFENPKEDRTPTNPKNSNGLVFTERDDSISGGYLPNNLLSSMTCGVIQGNIPNCGVPKLSSNQVQAMATNPQLKTNETKPETTTTPPTKKKNMFVPDEGDALETSTLDFLANLHVKEEELNFVFDSLENEEDDYHNLLPQCIGGTDQSTQLSSRNPTISSYITTASTPFERMVSPSSSFHDQLLKDPAYNHAMKAGTLWQSLCSQHVRFPAHWWDGQEPAGPPMGTTKKGHSKREWTYLGRHRVQGDPKLTRVVGNRASSGRILLHLIVRDDISGEPIEDIACGCFHPNARGIRVTKNYDPSIEDCRDVWIAHRRRKSVLVHGQDDAQTEFSSYTTTLESLLQHQNKGRVHQSPLGKSNLGGKDSKHAVTNNNLRTVFGSKPPVFTVFQLESQVFELFQQKLDGTVPASVALLRHYLGHHVQ